MKEFGDKVAFFEDMLILRGLSSQFEDKLNVMTFSCSYLEEVYGFMA